MSDVGCRIEKVSYLRKRGFSDIDEGIAKGSVACLMGTDAVLLAQIFNFDDSVV